MLRNALINCSRRAAQVPAARSAFSRPKSACIYPTSRSYTVLSRRIAIPASSRQLRWYSDSSRLNRTEVEGRIMDLLKNFDRVTDATKITPNSNFSKDLGLDSLDSVEVVMAIEEEFGIEIPDKEADAIQSVDQGVDYILKQPEAH